MDWRWIGLGVGVVVASVVLGPRVATAAPVTIDMNAEAELTAEGFAHNQGSGSSAFVDGTMVVTTTGFEEWILFDGTPSKWWDYVHPDKGWWVEARVRVDASEAGCSDVGPGMWIHDRGKLYKLRFGVDGLSVFPTGSASVDTSEFHVYRLEDYGDGTRRVLVDGVEVIDLTDDPGGAGTASLSIGDLGGCGASTAVWDYFSYDTFAPGAEDEDFDGDGVPNASDNCYDVPNIDQANQDADGLGDECDPCPIDPLDDSDLDGVCDSEDQCPSDPDITDEPCPDGESGFQGDGFGDEVGDGSASVSASNGDGSASGSATNGDTDSAGQGSPSGGCGCTSVGRTPPWFLLLLPLLFARIGLRRRRSPVVDGRV